MSKVSKDDTTPNFFQCPNILVDSLLCELNGSDLKCYLFIIRQTTGWHKKHDRISISQFVKMTGLSNRTVIDSCSKLAEMNLVVIDKNEHGEKSFSLRNMSDFVPYEKSSHSEKSSQGVVKKVHRGSEKSSQVASEKTSHTKDTLTKDTIQKKIKESCGEVVTDTQRATEANCATWEAYSSAYENRYHCKPIRNAQANGIISKFVKAVGQEDAPAIARYFINIGSQYYVQKMHDLKLLISDSQAIRTQWLTKRTMTAGQAKQQDQLQTAKSSVEGVLERRARRKAEAEKESGVIDGECTHV